MMDGFNKGISECQILSTITNHPRQFHAISTPCSAEADPELDNSS